MAGSKRKLKKKTIPPPPVTNQDDEDLMNELLAQLDSRDETVRAELATINEMNLNEQADANGRQDPKNRFKARLVRPRNCSNPQIIHMIPGQKSSCAC